MKKIGKRLAVILLVQGVCLGALAQGNSDALGSPVLVKDPCKRDVLLYQANIELVRKTLGESQAKELESKFMSKPDWNALLLQEGYCGIARRLRDKKLTR
jgi:hypothetical protein